MWWRSHNRIAKIIKSSIKHLLYVYWSGFLLKLRCFKSRAVSCWLFPGTECVSLLSSCVAAAPVKQLSTHVGLFCPTVAAPNSVPQPVCVISPSASSSSHFFSLTIFASLSRSFGRFCFLFQPSAALFSGEELQRQRLGYIIFEQEELFCRSTATEDSTTSKCCMQINLN